MSAEGLAGPFFFFDGTVTGERKLPYHVVEKTLCQLFTNSTHMTIALSNGTMRHHVTIETNGRSWLKHFLEVLDVEKSVPPRKKRKRLSSDKWFESSAMLSAEANSSEPLLRCSSDHNSNGNEASVKRGTYLKYKYHVRASEEGVIKSRVFGVSCELQRQLGSSGASRDGCSDPPECVGELVRSEEWD
ncbi:hypothetical protein PR048_023215 [Dryococelus australis]|uniref:Uncharacterized protein n=1 Tax=Dryococelus australis TaxID=614101 RepID=A0ABQ9GTG4_9NEOP|nr:hypothetical protein PR048_023215 [Dryococelus australis]